jgi:hypothetical protein
VKERIISKIMSWVLLVTFFVTSVMPSSYAQAVLPQVGTQMALSPTFMPPVLKGIRVDVNNPLKLDFILDRGKTTTNSDPGSGQVVGQVSPDPGSELVASRLIKYFLAALTVPEKDLWVNLSPYEKDRIVPEEFGQTEMGRDLLAQDYILKQITASVIYPEGETGKIFWQKVYAKAQETYGTIDIPVDTFNKVWIMPDKAVVYENALLGTAYVDESRLKVMLESDYVAANQRAERDGGEVPNPVNSATAMSNNPMPTRGHVAPQGYVSPSTLPTELPLNAKATQGSSPTPSTSELTKQILREVVIPILEKEVNEGQNFAQLRQVYHSLILAAWYKRKIKDSVLSAIYVDKNKVSGIGYALPARGHVAPQGYVSPSTLPSELPLNAKATQVSTESQANLSPDKIWAQYTESFKKGVYNYIKEKYDPESNEMVPRKYFSGGFSGDMSQIIDIRPISALKKVVLTGALLVSMTLAAAVVGVSEAQAQMQATSAFQMAPPDSMKIISKSKLREESAAYDVGRFKNGEMFTIGHDGSVRIWEADKTGQREQGHKLSLESEIYSADDLPNGDIITMSRDNLVSIWSKNLLNNLSVVYSFYVVNNSVPEKMPNGDLLVWKETDGIKRMEVLRKDPLKDEWRSVSTFGEIMGSDNPSELLSNGDVVIKTKTGIEVWRNGVGDDWKQVSRIDHESQYFYFEELSNGEVYFIDADYNRNLNRLTIYRQKAKDQWEEVVTPLSSFTKDKINDVVVLSSGDLLVGVGGGDVFEQTGRMLILRKNRRGQYETVSATKYEGGSLRTPVQRSNGDILTLDDMRGEGNSKIHMWHENSDGTLKDLGVLDAGLRVESLNLLPNDQLVMLGFKGEIVEFKMAYKTSKKQRSDNESSTDKIYDGGGILSATFVQKKFIPNGSSTNPKTDGKTSSGSKGASSNTVPKPKQVTFSEKRAKVAEDSLALQGRVQEAQKRTSDSIAQVAFAERKRLEALEDPYTRMMRLGNEALLLRQWGGARFYFRKAMDYRPGDGPATNKINDVKDSIGADLLARRQANFEMSRMEGDEAFSNERYAVASFFYRKALSFVSGDKAVLEKLQAAKEIISQSQMYYVEPGELAPADKAMSVKSVLSKGFMGLAFTLSLWVGTANLARAQAQATDPSVTQTTANNQDQQKMPSMKVVSKFKYGKGYFFPLVVLPDGHVYLKPSDKEGGAIWGNDGSGDWKKIDNFDPGFINIRNAFRVSKFFVVLGDGKAKIFEKNWMGKWKLFSEFAADNGFLPIELSNGNFLTKGVGGMIQIRGKDWELIDGLDGRLDVKNEINIVKELPNGDLLVYGYGSPKFEIRRITDGGWEYLSTCDAGVVIKDIIRLSNGDFLVTGLDQKYRVLHHKIADQWELLAEFGDGLQMNGVEELSNGDIIISVDKDVTNARNVSIWRKSNAGEWKEIVTIDHSGWHLPVELSNGDIVSTKNEIMSIWRESSDGQWKCVSILNLGYTAKRIVQLSYGRFLVYGLDGDVTIVKIESLLKSNNRALPNIQEIEHKIGDELKGDSTKKDSKTSSGSKGALSNTSSKSKLKPVTFSEKKAKVAADSLVLLVRVQAAQKRTADSIAQVALAERKRLEALEDPYTRMMRLGNEAVSFRQWGVARFYFRRALLYSPGDVPATSRIQDVADSIRTDELAQRQANFEMSRMEGDEAFANERYAVAIFFYRKALSFVSGDKAVLEKLQAANEIISQSQMYYVKPGELAPGDNGQKVDRAQALKGGIDLNPQQIDFKTANTGGEIKFNIDPGLLQQLQNAPGLVPVSINITPLTNIGAFLGVQASSGDSAVSSLS